MATSVTRIRHTLRTTGADRSARVSLMADPLERPTPAEVEARFRDLLRDGGIEQPDEVAQVGDPDRLVFIWRRQRVAIEVELPPRRPVEVRNGSGH